MSIRNNNIDIIKGIGCMSVVMIHYNFPGYFGIYSKPINRFAVPFFFFVSGYFLLDHNNHISLKKICNKIEHIIKLLFKSGNYYFIFCVLFNISRYNKDFNIGIYYNKIIIRKKMIKFIINNCPFVYSHLWFLLALLYCYLFIFIIAIIKSNLITNKIFLYFLIFFGIFGYTFLAEFSNQKLIKELIFYKYFPNNIVIYHIFIFRALPFFILGIVSKFNVKFEMKCLNLFLLFIFGSFISYMEKYLITKDLNTYLGTYIQIISLIFICTSKQNLKNKYKILSFIGRELSDKIYIYHISIGEIILFYFNKYFI